jgi:hypothetical protein
MQQCYYYISTIFCIQVGIFLYLIKLDGDVDTFADPVPDPHHFLLNLDLDPQLRLMNPDPYPTYTVCFFYI